MTTGPAMTADKRPVLTSQPTRGNRIGYVAFGVVLMGVVVYVTNAMFQDYSEDPTIENLFIFAVLCFSGLVVALWMAHTVTKKVEFFDNHLVAHSLRVFSRTRMYQEIIRLEVSFVQGFRQVFVITFSDGGKIAVHNDEIHFDELAEWLEQRGVRGVGAVKKNIFRNEYLDRFHNRR